MRRVRVGTRLISGLVIAAMLLSGAGWASAQEHAPPAVYVPHAGSEDLTVTVGTAFAFTVSTSEVTPGDSINLTLVQTNDVLHTFTLLSVANFSFNPSTNTSQQIATFLTAHPPLVNYTFPGTPGQVSMTFTAPPIGVYQYLCLAPGHFLAGMWGLLGSGVAPPSTSTSTGPGAPVFIITGTIVSLVVIAIVLGFVVGRRRGSTDEMPPERLGYPEKSSQTPLPPQPSEPKK